MEDFQEMFNLFSYVFIGVTILFISVFVYTIIVRISNSKKPILTVMAEVLNKRIKTSNTTRWRNNSHRRSLRKRYSYDYYVTFQVESGDKLVFPVPQDEYERLWEGDKGKLTFQGGWYKGFEKTT